MSSSWLNSHNTTVKSRTPSPLKADSRSLFPQIKFQNHRCPAQSESAGAADAHGAARPVAGLGAGADRADRPRGPRQPSRSAPPSRARARPPATPSFLLAVSARVLGAVRLAEGRGASRGEPRVKAGLRRGVALGRHRPRPRPTGQRL